MGQYLSVGIVTRIAADKERAVQLYGSVEDFKTGFEKEFNQRKIYQLSESESSILLELKPEVAEKEWVPFIRDFYDLCYNGNVDVSKELDALSKENSLESWLRLADERKLYYYQTDGYMERYPMQCPNAFHRSLYVSMKQVILAIDGKIIMESYRGMFDFFARSIRKCLSDYRLADSLYVSITG